MSRDQNMSPKDQAKQKPISEIFPGSLKRYGKVLRGLCPIHQDQKNPNFTIYPQTNSFYCFSCGKGGDVITFWMLLNNVDFTTAIRELT